MLDRCLKADIRQPEFRINAGYFILTLWRKTAGIESRLESALAAKILLILKIGEQGKSGMASELGHKTVSGELHKQVKRLLELELIEMTIPDKPNSRLQKYRLTEKGKRFLIEKE